MWVVVDKLATEQDSATKGEPQTYVAFSVWADEASHGKGEPPLGRADCLSSAGLLPDSITRFARDEFGNLLLRRGGFWTADEYAAEYRAYRERKRENPNADLAVETVAVDLVAALKQKIILPQLEGMDARGQLSGSKTGSVREKQPEPEDKAEKSELKNLVGGGFELLLKREQEAREKLGRAK